jgi:hypothetical protein
MMVELCPQQVSLRVHLFHLPTSYCFAVAGKLRHSDDTFVSISQASELPGRSGGFNEPAQVV